MSSGGHPKTESSSAPYTFSRLLDEKQRFFEDLLGSEELDTIRGLRFSEDNSLDMNPTFPTRESLYDFWKSVVARFSATDEELSLTRGQRLDELARQLREGFFDRSNTTGLGILIVGCYHVELFNRDDVVTAAREFLDSSQAEDYLLITACGEDVMVAQEEDGSYKNRFLDLVTDNVYADRVFPIRLPERPELHFSARVFRQPEKPHRLECHVGFETHHYEGDEYRTRVRTESEDAFRLAFRSFARYLLDENRRSRCVVCRDTKAYRKYLPQFFYAYRQLPPYLRGRIHIDFAQIAGK